MVLKKLIKELLKIWYEPNWHVGNRGNSLRLLDLRACFFCHDELFCADGGSTMDLYGWSPVIFCPVCLIWPLIITIFYLCLHCDLILIYTDFFFNFFFYKLYIVMIRLIGTAGHKLTKTKDHLCISPFCLRFWKNGLLASCIHHCC